MIGRVNSKRRSDVLVLEYHAVSAIWRAALSITPRRLEEHLSLLVTRGWRGATAHEAIYGPPAGRTLVVTFDDAYRSVLEMALPILARLGLPGTVFAPTDFVGSGRPMSWPGVDRWTPGPHAHELVPLSWEELDELARAGWEIGAHGRSHRRLSTLDDAEREEELRGSRERLEERLGRPCRSMAYPFGDHDARVVEAVRAAGYEAAFAGPDGGIEFEPLRWPRVGVFHDDDGLVFRAKVSRPVRRVRHTPVWQPVARAVRGLRGH